MKALRVWQLGVLAAALMLGGCGEESSGTAAIQLESPGVRADGEISPQVNCGSGTLWLPLKWGSIPSDAEELILYFGQFKDETGSGARKLDVPFAALITGIDPAQRGNAANTFPPGIEFMYFQPRNSCPPEREGQNILAELFALDEAGEQIPASLNEAFVTQLTEEALGVEPSGAGSASARELRDEALAVGRFTANYGSR